MKTFFVFAFVGAVVGLFSPFGIGINTAILALAVIATLLIESIRKKKAIEKLQARARMAELALEIGKLDDAYNLDIGPDVRIEAMAKLKFKAIEFMALNNLVKDPEAADLVKGLFLEIVQFEDSYKESVAA